MFRFLLPLLLLATPAHAECWPTCDNLYEPYYERPYAPEGSGFNYIIESEPFIPEPREEPDYRSRERDRTAPSYERPWLPPLNDPIPPLN